MSNNKKVKINVEKIYENISTNRYLTENASYPMLLTNKNIVVWFNYRYDISKNFCFVTSIFTCNYDGDEMRNIETEEISSNLNILESVKDINLEEFEGDIEFEKFWNKFGKTKDINEQLNWIKESNDSWFIGLYEKVLTVLE